MIQSGTGQFKDITIVYNGKTVTKSQTIKFSKPFNNPPVVVLSIIGAGLDFTANGNTNNDGGNVIHLLKRYIVTALKVSNNEFVANLEAFPLPFPFSPTVNINDVLIDFNWIAYDEVTIGA